MDIREIARRAKVSTATVSRTINHVPTVDPQLAKRVWKVVDALGYYPNTQARALVSGRSRIFGLIVSEITNPFFPEIVQVFEDTAVEHGYEILLTSTVHDTKRMEITVRRMIERRVDGIAVMTFGMEERLLIGSAKLRNVPLVFVDVGPHSPRVSNIRIDYQHGIQQAVQHLAAFRHERIAFVTGPVKLRSAMARRRAFESSMREIGLKVEGQLIVEGDHTIEGGMKAAQKLLAAKPRPSAIMCSNDMTALGVMHECYEEGIEIPKELSVIGYDDIRLAGYTLPPLTTIRMSQPELARLAFRALLAEVQRSVPSETGTEYALETSLVLRKSTALAPGRTSTRAAKSPHVSNQSTD
ncbi:MAG TPA: LacI family DNA-binding transcriptional regulator [Terriglobales bacterium]|nr:LacI family DNA-binding transcriptional regulator [Terriglobales bacterium]